MKEDERELADVRHYWHDRMRDRILDLSRPGGGTTRIFTDDEYEPWHRFWTSHADSLTAKAKNAWPFDSEVGKAVEFIRHLVACTTGGAFRGWLLGHSPPSPTMHVAEYYVRVVDATFDRYAAKLANIRAHEPTWAARLWAWVASRPDWLEGHRVTLVALLMLVALVLAWRAPEILQRWTEFVRAVRAG